MQTEKADDHPTALRDPPTPRATIGRPDDYLHEAHTLRSWFFTTDHKRIGLLYLIAITVFFIVGAIAAGLVRLALVVPDGQIFTNDTYNKLFTIHGVVMVWFFLIPSIPATFGNFLLPIMIGAKDLAFPRLNLLSWYVFMGGSLFTMADHRDRRRRYRLDLLRAVQHDLLQHLRHPGADRRHHRRLLVDPDRAQLRRHGPHDAGAGHDLVPHADLRLDHVRDEPDLPARRRRSSPSR